MSRRQRTAFLRFRFLQLLVAAAIPVAAAARASSVVVAVLGAVVVLLQGFDQLLQWGRRYLATPEAADEIRREHMLWQTQAGAYAATEEPNRLFAERVADIRSRFASQVRELTREELDKEKQAK
jgi:hypothetical protein